MINAALRIWKSVPGASWLTPDRARAYCRVLLSVTVLLAAANVAVALRNDGWDFNGKPLGTDFLCFWTAARLALTGSPADAYSPALQYALERATFAGADPGYFAFIYPPATLLLCLPLGLMPYLIALLVWLTSTGAAYLSVMWNLLGRDRRLLVSALAFPAVLVNCGHGQNAFLTTALFGGGLLLLARYPIWAGLLLGSLIVKPHLGLLIPVYLLAGGYGLAFLAACAAVGSWIALSLLAFGPATWGAYLDAAALARTTLEQGLVEPEKMQSLFAAVRLWHGSVSLAYGAQAAAAILVGGAVALLARRRPDLPAGGAALVAGTLLTTPYVLDYDLTLLAIPLAYLARQIGRTGLRGWEINVALAAFLLPLVTRLIATQLALPLGPFVIAALFGVVWRRAWVGSTAAFGVETQRAASQDPVPNRQTT